MGILHTYMGGGYLFRMTDNASHMANALRDLQSLNWLDRQTAAVFVEFSLYNANLNLFQMCAILFEITPTGSLVNTAQFYPIDLLDIEGSGLLAFKIIMHMVFMAFVGVFMIVEVKHVVRVRGKYFTDLNNYIELSIIGFSWAAFAMYLYRMYAAYELVDELRQAIKSGLGHFNSGSGSEK